MGSLSTARRGFTLIELLLVVGIIAILASIVIVAINPTKQLGDTRNAQRKADVNTILSAVYQYSIDNNGSLPGGITTTAKNICQSDMTLSQCNTLGGVSLSVLTGSYVVKIPKDPSVSATGTGTNYWIVKDANGRITVTAPNAEPLGTATPISITR